MAVLLRDRLVDVLNNEIEVYVRTALQIKNPGKGVTADQIAFVVLEANAFRRALELSRSAVLDEYVKLVTPDSIPSGVSEEADPDGLYP